MVGGRLVDQLRTLLPAEHIPHTLAFHDHLHGAFTADFEDHARVVALRDVGIAGHKERIGVGVGRRHVETAHAGAFADLVDRHGQVVLRQRTQLGFGFGIVEIDLRRAQQRPVRRAFRGAAVGRRRDELDRFVTVIEVMSFGVAVLSPLAM